MRLLLPFISIFAPLFLIGQIGTQLLDDSLRQCINKMFKTCTYATGSFSSNPLASNPLATNGRKKRVSDVNCYADGTCVLKPTPNRDTCCKICKSCTFQGCCHCSFTEADKYCPIPGWRAPDYTGDKNAPLVKRDPGGCDDPEDFSRRIYQHAMMLLAAMVLDQLSGFLYSPYTRYSWNLVDVIGTNVRPNDGQVIVRRIEGAPDSATRVEFLERYIRPEDLRPRTGDFSDQQRQGLMASHNARPGDQMGHIVANTLGGPNTLNNFFPQHATVNANRDGVWLMDSWVDTENAMRAYLRQGRPGSYVLFRVLLIYPHAATGRPDEIAWAALFYDPNTTNGTVYAVGGRVENADITEQGPQGICRPGATKR